MIGKRKDKKKKKMSLKSKAAVGGCAIIAFILATLGLDIGGLGSGMGLAIPAFAPAEQQTEHNPSDDANTPAPDTEQATDSQQADGDTAQGSDHEDIPEPLSRLISITGDSIIHNGQTLSPIELIEFILQVNQPDYIWELRDDHAIMATYNEVRMLLIENDVRFEETAG